MTNRFRNSFTVVMAFGASLSAHASALQVTPASHCGGEISLSARKVRLSEALAELAQSLNFALEFKSGRDPVIDTELHQPIVKLLMSLTRSQNLVLEDAADPQCSGLRRIIKVTMLPESHDAPARRLPPPPYVTPTMTSEQKAGLAIYRRAHGLDENGQPIKRLPSENTDSVKR